MKKLLMLRPILVEAAREAKEEGLYAFVKLLEETIQELDRLNIRHASKLAVIRAEETITSNDISQIERLLGAELPPENPNKKKEE